ncbi:unnamed protein product [Polarella glacialis]|uniref:Uncharacterized protein n=1 Tax=Polarella glacialis TaxID=89957 RepID=A0A813HCK5_POLGL|nr:unnamed protein product [Polarella glacialis]
MVQLRAGLALTTLAACKMDVKRTPEQCAAEFYAISGKSAPTLLQAERGLAVAQPGPEPSTEATTLTEHTKGVLSVAFNPDGGLLASGSLDHTLKVFATSSWEEVATLKLWLGDGDISSVAFSPDGGLLASASWFYTAEVFATSTWEKVTKLAQHTLSVHSVAFHPDGGLLASGSHDKTVKVFATSSWEVVATLTEHTNWVLSVAFHPDGGLLASGSADSTVKVFATSTWRKVATLKRHTSDVRSVAFHPDGGLLASGSRDKTVKVFATSTWRQVTTLKQPTGCSLPPSTRTADCYVYYTTGVFSVAFHPDGGLLASGNAGNSVKVFATSTWEEVTTPTEHTDVVSSVAFHPDGGLLASGSADHTVKAVNGAYEITIPAVQIPASDAVASRVALVAMLGLWMWL